MNRKYTDEHIRFLTENIKGTPFGMALKVGTVVSLTARHGLHNGIDTRLNKGYAPTQFKKGNIPYNKGVKGIRHAGSEAGWFKPGNRSRNYRPVGSERVSKDGYIEVKVADPKTWRMKHVIVWEQAHGPVPKGHVIIFGDGDRRNCALDNLILVSRAKLARANQNHLLQNDIDLTRTGLLIADVLMKCGERRKQ